MRRCAGKRVLRVGVDVCGDVREVVGGRREDWSFEKLGERG